MLNWVKITTKREIQGAYFVLIATELKQSDSGIDITLTVHNATQFPILSMRGDLTYDESKV